MKKNLLLLCFLIAIQASYSQWESAGWRNDPYINAMTVSGGNVIISQNGIKISSDRGKNWGKKIEIIY